MAAGAGITQPFTLGLLICRGDFDPPGPLVGMPAIPPRLQRIFGLVRSIRRLDPRARLLCLPDELGQRGFAIGHRAAKQVDRRPDVDRGPVAMIEHALLHEEMAKLATVEAQLGPWHLVA